MPLGAQSSYIPLAITTPYADPIIAAATGWRAHGLDACWLAADVRWQPIRELCLTANARRCDGIPSLGASRCHINVLSIAYFGPAGGKVCLVS